MTIYLYHCAFCEKCYAHMSDVILHEKFAHKK